MRHIRHLLSLSFGSIFEIEVPGKLLTPPTLFLVKCWALFQWIYFQWCFLGISYPGLSKSSIILAACTRHSTNVWSTTPRPSQGFNTGLLCWSFPQNDSGDRGSLKLSLILNTSETSGPFWGWEARFLKFLFSMDSIQVKQLRLTA